MLDFGGEPVVDGVFKSATKHRTAKYPAGTLAGAEEDFAAIARDAVVNKPRKILQRDPATHQGLASPANKKASQISTRREGGFKFDVFQGESIVEPAVPDFNRVVKEKALASARRMPAQGRWGADNYYQLPQLVRNKDKIARLERFLPSTAVIAYNPEAREDRLGWEHPIYKKWKWFLIDEAICQECGQRPISETTKLKISGDPTIIWTDSTKTHCNQCWASKQIKEAAMEAPRGEPKSLRTSTIEDDVSSLGDASLVSSIRTTEMASKTGAGEGAPSRTAVMTPSFQWSAAGVSLEPTGGPRMGRQGATHTPGRSATGGRANDYPCWDQIQNRRLVSEAKVAGVAYLVEPMSDQEVDLVAERRTRVESERAAKMREVYRGNLSAQEMIERMGEELSELMSWQVGANEYYQGIAASYISHVAEISRLPPSELEAEAEDLRNVLVDITRYNFLLMEIVEQQRRMDTLQELLGEAESKPWRSRYYAQQCEDTQYASREGGGLITILPPHMQGGRTDLSVSAASKSSQAQESFGGGRNTSQEAGSQRRSKELPSKPKPGVSGGWEEVPQKSSVRKKSVAKVSSETEDSNQYSSLESSDGDSSEESEDSDQSSGKDPGKGRREQSDSEKESRRGSPLKKFSRKYADLSHHKFCSKLYKQGLDKAVAKALLKYKTERVRRCIRTGGDGHSAALGRMPLFKLLPKSSNNKFPHTVRKISAISGAKDEDLIQCLEEGLQMAENRKLSRKEAFNMLRTGELFEGKLLADYRARSTLAGFKQREEKDDNEVLYWGKAIIDWMITMITVFGIRQVESSINADIDALEVSPTGPAAVHANWVEMRRLFSQLPEGHASAVVQMSRWTAKLCQAGWYGKKWAAELDAYRDKHKISAWTLETMENAQTHVYQLAGQPSNTWLQEAQHHANLTSMASASAAPTGRVRKVAATTAEVTTASTAMDPPNPPPPTRNVCAHCYGYHRESSPKLGRGCIDREPMVQGEYPERPKTIGFKITGMRWLGHPTGDERFFRKLAQDPHFLKLSGEEQSRLRTIFEEISKAQKEGRKAQKGDTPSNYTSAVARVKPEMEVSNPNEEGGTAPGESRTVAAPASETGELGFIEGAVVPIRTLIKMNFAKAVNEGANAKPGPLVFFTSTMWSAGQEKSMTLPVGGDSMSEISLVSRHLVSRMKWEEILMPAERWFTLKGCIAGMEVQTIRTQVKVLHTLRGTDGSVVVRAAMHYVIEDATFDVLVGNDVLGPWKGMIDLGKGRFVIEDDGVERRVPTYGLKEAVAYVQRHADFETKQSDIWREFARTSRCLATWTKKELQCKGMHLEPGKWVMVGFQRQSEATPNSEYVYRICKDRTPIWRDIDGVKHHCVKFATSGYCRGGVRVYVQNTQDYAIELSRGDLVVEVTPVIRTPVYQFEEVDKPEQRVACATLPENVGHLLEKPPCIFPPEAEILWHAMSPENKLKLHEFAGVEGSDAVLQAAQLRELFLKLDIYDSGVVVERGPWMTEGETLRIPEETLRSIMETYPELHTNESAPPGSAQGEEMMNPSAEENFSKNSSSASGSKICADQEDHSGQGQSGSA
jgi:hypothetical protein